MPAQTCRSFHGKAATDARVNVPLLPAQTCHPLREPSATQRITPQYREPFSPPAGGAEATPEVSDGQVHAVGRLTWAVGLSARQMARRLGRRRPPVAAYVQRAHGAGLAWPQPAGLAAATLAQRLFASSATPVPAPRLAPEGATGPHDRKRQGVPWCRLWPA
jgi:hypothetical protein